MKPTILDARSVEVNRVRRQLEVEDWGETGPFEGGGQLGGDGAAVVVGGGHQTDPFEVSWNDGLCDEEFGLRLRRRAADGRSTAPGCGSAMGSDETGRDEWDVGLGGDLLRDVGRGAVGAADDRPCLVFEDQFDHLVGAGAPRVVGPASDEPDRVGLRCRPRR